MEFIDSVKQFASRAVKLKDSLQSEEAAKTSLVMPFFSQVLGYDVFNPEEFCPEYIADVGTKKGERVDYALLFDGKPVIVVEVKRVDASSLILDKAGDQLFRYFSANVHTRFGILTNGVVYRFYTDLTNDNMLDTKPFLEIDLSNINEQSLPELLRFRRAKFDANEAFTRAEELQYSSEIRSYFLSLLESPTDDFVRFMGRSCHSGVMTRTVVERLRPIVRSTLSNLVEDTVRERIERALASPKPEPPVNTKSEEKESVPASQPPQAESSERSNRRPPTRFVDMGIPVGAELRYVADESVVCTVKDDTSKVVYLGVEYSLSALARKLIKDRMGKDVSVAGARHFKYGDKTVWELRLEKENEE